MLKLSAYSYTAAMELCVFQYKHLSKTSCLSLHDTKEETDRQTQNPNHLWERLLFLMHRALLGKAAVLYDRTTTGQQTSQKGNLALLNQSGDCYRR